MTIEVQSSESAQGWECKVTVGTPGDQTSHSVTVARSIFMSDGKTEAPDELSKSLLNFYWKENPRKVSLGLSRLKLLVIISPNM